MVGEEGFEPSRSKEHQILSLARLPVPPLALEAKLYPNLHNYILNTRELQPYFCHESNERS